MQGHLYIMSPRKLLVRDTSQLDDSVVSPFCDARAPTLPPTLDFPAFEMLDILVLIDQVTLASQYFATLLGS